MLGSVFLEMIESLNNTLFAAGYQLMLGQSGYSPEHEDALLEAIIGRRPDGIFITGVMHAGKGRTKLLASGIPVVETWDLTPTPIDMLIGFSHEKIGRETAEFLIKKTHKRFALIRAGDERAERRAAAFQETLAKHGLHEAFVVNVGAARTIMGGREALVSILQNAADVDAVFCSSDLLALGAITEAVARGITVPRQIAIMGFGDVPFLESVIPALTTVRINGAAMGRTAADFLVARAEGRVVDKRIVDVGFSIIARESA
jgi:LacI family gluconate utilization system Gnt-I transcriptional repressor